MNLQRLIGLLLFLPMPWSGLAWSAQDAGSPRMNYMLHCSGCHGADGSGSPSSGVPTMRGSLGHFLKVEGGRQFLVQVPGMSQSPLSDAETAELLNWILKAFSAAETPPGTLPYTASEVTRLRARHLEDVPATRADILQQLKGLGITIN